MSFITIGHQYEYRVADQDMTPENLEKFLNLAGQEGWRLHSIQKYTIILEREL